MCHASWNVLQLVELCFLFFFISTEAEFSSAGCTVISLFRQGEMHSPWQSPTFSSASLQFNCKESKDTKRLMSQELSKPLNPNPKKKMVNHSGVLKWSVFWICSTSFESLSSLLLLVNDRTLKTYTGQKIDDFDREGQ